MREGQFMMKESGRVAEWLMAPVLKTGVPERVSGVRIPPLPPYSLKFSILWPNFADEPRNSAEHSEIRNQKVLAENAKYRRSGYLRRGPFSGER